MRVNMKAFLQRLKLYHTNHGISPPANNKTNTRELKPDVNQQLHNIAPRYDLSNMRFKKELYNNDALIGEISAEVYCLPREKMDIVIFMQNGLITHVRPYKIQTT